LLRNYEEIGTSKRHYSVLISTECWSWTSDEGAARDVVPPSCLRFILIWESSSGVWSFCWRDMVFWPRTGLEMSSLESKSNLPVLKVLFAFYFMFLRKWERVSLVFAPAKWEGTGDWEL
jgi:hypothetical protein